MADETTTPKVSDNTSSTVDDQAASFLAAEQELGVYDESGPPPLDPTAAFAVVTDATVYETPDLPSDVLMEWASGHRTPAFTYAPPYTADERRHIDTGPGTEVYDHLADRYVELEARVNGVPETFYVPAHEGPEYEDSELARLIEYVGGARGELAALNEALVPIRYTVRGYVFDFRESHERWCLEEGYVEAGPTGPRVTSNARIAVLWADTGVLLSEFVGLALPFAIAYGWVALFSVSSHILPLMLFLCLTILQTVVWRTVNHHELKTNVRRRCVQFWVSTRTA
jgi:hypothetical protein